MYKVISANRSANRDPKNWRVFEQDAVEKHFGKVINCDGEDGRSVLEVYNKYKDTIKYIRWYPDPELMNKREYLGMVKQSEEIGPIPYLVNSASGFKNVQCKDSAFEKWKSNGVNCPSHFVFNHPQEFYDKLDEADFSMPFLIRMNNSVAGKHTYFIREKKEIEGALRRVQDDYNWFCSNGIGIESKMMCVQFVDTIDKNRNVNFSFRIHATANRVVSGYGRVVSAEDWLAITAGKFDIKNIDNWIYYNKLCEEVCEKHEKEICYAVESLDLNMQGIDVVIDQSTNKLCFIEVQPTYASGYPEEGYCGYYKPFYNPKDSDLVNFLIKEKTKLEKEIPMYYNNWLNKENHFDLMYSSLKEFLNVRS